VFLAPGGGLTLPLLKWSGMSRGNAHSGSSGDSGEQEFELLANGDDASAALHAQGEEESKQNNNHAQLVQDEDGGFIPASDGPSEAQRSPYTGLVGRFKRFDKQVMRRIFGGAEAARGVNTGVIDDYGAPIPQQGEEADVRSFVMVSLSHNHRVDPETAHLPHQHPGSSPGSGRGSITGTGNGGLPAAGRPARNGGESISPNVSEDHYSYPRGKRTAPPAHPHPAQLLQSYRQDEDELKSIFKSSASTPSSGSHVVYPASVATSQLSGSAYQPPVFSPHTDTLQPSPLPTSALMKDSSSPPGTASGLEDPEQL
jgi:hypothetical protein